MLDEVRERERALMAQMTELQQLKASRPFRSPAGDNMPTSCFQLVFSSPLLLVFRAGNKPNEVAYCQACGVSLSAFATWRKHFRSDIYFRSVVGTTTPEHGEICHRSPVNVPQNRHRTQPPCCGWMRK